MPPVARQPQLDPTNIQGDILSGLPKKSQLFVFFQITNVSKFRSELKSFVPLVKTAAGVLQDLQAISNHKKSGGKGLITMVGVNIAFSHHGFAQMKIDDSSLGSGSSDPFIIGQLKDSPSLNDPTTRTHTGTQPDWDPIFLQQLHGVILITGDSQATTNKQKQQIDNIFGVGGHNASITEIASLQGDVRTGDQDGHEPFGFLDGISNPNVKGFDVQDQHAGPAPVDPGIMLTGYTGDPLQSKRAAWATDGSFLAFRYLFQLVPEFNQFLEQNALSVPGLTHDQGRDLLGARIMGRWKSGTPVDLAPLKDDLSIANDLNRINNFSYAGEQNSQTRCPFGAHLRKTNPRDGLLPQSPDKYRIARRGIPFGPEVTKQEANSNKTSQGRGLLFACYQSSLQNGFRFVQESWSNTATFPAKTTQQAGLDGLTGQGSREMSGLDPNHPNVVHQLPTFVVTRGGEYFFSPSIKGLQNTIAT